MYLQQSNIEFILKKISTHFPQSTIIFDYLHRSILTDAKKIDAEHKGTALHSMLESFKKKGAPMQTGFDQQSLKALANKTGFVLKDNPSLDQVARQYQVDQNPYYTAAVYYMATFVSKGLCEENTIERTPAESPRVS